MDSIRQDTTSRDQEGGVFDVTNVRGLTNFISTHPERFYSSYSGDHKKAIGGKISVSIRSYQDSPLGASDGFCLSERCEKPGAG